MDPDTALAISSELRFALKQGWVVTKDVNRFYIAPPDDIKSSPDFYKRLRGEVWRISQFVAYSNFVSIAKTPTGGYLITSHMASGEGFEIQFDPV